ncbi:ribonuclease P protein component [Bacteroidota bacterium]
MAEYTFHKDERLKSRKSIESLFQSGKSISSPPFRLFYRQVEELPGPARMTVAVPRRLIKRAVDRNLIKRRTREAYRIRKSAIYEACLKKNARIELIFLYQSSEILDYKTISRSVQFLLMKLAEQV